PMTSEKKIAANRMNAQRSTGPRTAAGKERSRRNALKHGLSGHGGVLNDHERAELKGTLAFWELDIRPPGATQLTLVEHLALSGLLFNKARREELAVAAKRRREAIDHWDEERIASVDHQIKRLDNNDELTEALKELKKTALGCHRLLHQWARLDAAV